MLAWLTLELLTTSATAQPWRVHEVANPSQVDLHPVHPAIYVDVATGPGRMDIVYEVIDTDPVGATQHNCNPITEPYTRSLHVKPVSIVPFAKGPRRLISEDMLHNASYSPYLFPHVLDGDPVIAVMHRMTRNRDFPTACAEPHTGMQLVLLDPQTHEVLGSEPIVDLDDTGGPVCESVGVAGATTAPDPLDPLADDTVFATFTRKGATDDAILMSRPGDAAGWDAYSWIGSDVPFEVAAGAGSQDHPDVVARVANGVHRAWVAHEDGASLQIVRVEEGTATPLHLDQRLVQGDQSNLPYLVGEPIPDGLRLHLVWEEQATVPFPRNRVVHATCDDTDLVDCTVYESWTIAANGIEPSDADPQGPQVAVAHEGDFASTVVIAYVDDVPAGPDRVHVAWRCAAGDFAGLWQDEIVDGSAEAEAMRMLLADADDNCVENGRVPRSVPQVEIVNQRAVVTYIREEAPAASGDWSVQIAHKRLAHLCPGVP